MVYVPIWMQQLQPASWNGVAFVVENTSFTFGRRVVVHEYPFRDHPWVEGLGRDKQQVSFRGVLCGDNVYDLRDSMMKACDQPGVGKLVHPSLGSQKAYLVNASFGETKERGRLVEVDLTFIIAGDVAKITYPVSSINTQLSTLNFAAGVGGASQSDFLSQVGTALNQGAVAVNEVTRTVTSFANTMLAPLRDAAQIANMVNGMGVLLDGSHSYGRYIGGNVGLASSVLGSINTGLSMTARTTAGISALVNDTVALRSSVSSAVTSVTNAVSFL